LVAAPLHFVDRFRYRLLGDSYTIS
jgi:hypothetical protein